MTPTPNPKKVLAGRIGGLTNSARHTPEQMVAAAHRGTLAKFEREVDPEGVLPLEERQRRATAARKAHMAKLSNKAAALRRAA